MDPYSFMSIVCASQLECKPFEGRTLSVFFTPVSPALGAAVGT